jgi:hypothetical protein
MCHSIIATQNNKNQLGVQEGNLILLIYLFIHGATTRSGLRLPRYRGFTITLRHTTLSRNPLDELSVRRRDADNT